MIDPFLFCPLCNDGKEWPSVKSRNSHMRIHRKNRKLIRHGTVGGYLAEARAAVPDRTGPGAGKARAKVKHCRPCRDAWNSYFRIYKAERVVLKAQAHLAELKKKVI